MYLIVKRCEFQANWCRRTQQPPKQTSPGAEANQERLSTNTPDGMNRRHPPDLRLLTKNLFTRQC